MRYLLVLLFDVRLIFCSQLVCQSSTESKQNCYITQDGNIIAIIFLPLCLHETDRNEKKFLFTETMRYAANQINMKIIEQDDHLNITFGYKIHDTCEMSYEMISETFLSYILHESDNSTEISTTTDSHSNTACSCARNINNKKFVIGFIGDFQTQPLEFAINVFLPYEYPIVTVSIQAPDMSRQTKGVYARMPLIGLTARSLVEMFPRFGWKYTAIIVTDDPFGNEGKDYIKSELEKNEVCISFIKYFHASDDSLHDIIKTDPHLKVVFVWLELDNYFAFFEYASKHKLQNITWLVNSFPMAIPDAFWLSLDPLCVHGTILLKGAIAKSLKTDITFAGFPSYLENQTTHHKMTNNFLPYDITTVNHLMTALRTFQFHIESTLKSNFSNFDEFTASLHVKSTEKTSMITYLWPFLYIPSADILIFNIRNGTINPLLLAAYIKIGYWVYWQVAKYDFPVWAGYNEERPNGRCDNICSAGHYPIFIGGSQCCWSCHTCTKGTAKNETGNAACKQCPQDTLPNINRTICISFRNVFLTFNNQTSYIIYGIVGFGELLTLITTLVIICYRNTPVVRLSNLPVSVLQLSCHTMLSAIPIIHIGQPSQLKCIIGPFAISTLFIIIVGILFAKTNYLVQIFKSKGRETGRRVKIRKYKQYFHICLFAITNASIFVLHVSRYPVTIAKKKYSANMTCELTCGNIRHTVVQTMVIATLLFSCAFQAFRARNLPGSFKEAHALMYSTFIVSVTFFISPLIYNGVERMTENALARSLVTFCGNIVLLIFTFAGKCYVVLFRPDLNTDKRVRQSTLEAMKKKVNQRMSVRNNLTLTVT